MCLNITMDQTKYKTICISDTHLGTKDAKADILNNFLKHHSCENLFLIGDIIDGWKIQQNKWRWRQSHSNVVRRILGMGKHGTRLSMLQVIMMNSSAHSSHRHLKWVIYVSSTKQSIVALMVYYF
jgi:hypothetical protein